MSNKIDESGVTELQSTELKSWDCPAPTKSQPWGEDKLTSWDTEWPSKSSINWGKSSSD